MVFQEYSLKKKNIEYLKKHGPFSYVLRRGGRWSFNSGFSAVSPVDELTFIPFSLPPSPSILQQTCATTNCCTARTAGPASTTCGASAPRPTRASCARSSSASGSRAAAAAARAGPRGRSGPRCCCRPPCWRPRRSPAAEAAPAAAVASDWARSPGVRCWSPERGKE